MDFTYGSATILETGDDEIDCYIGKTGQITKIERDEIVTLFHVTMPDGNAIVVNFTEVKIGSQDQRLRVHPHDRRCNG